VTYRSPESDDIRRIAQQLGMSLSAAEAEQYCSFIQKMAPAMRLVDELPDAVPAVKYPRTRGYRPQGEENRYGAWYYKSSIKGAPTGKLQGKRVAVKDNVCVAGIPLANGSSVLEGFVPDIDATIVTRMLDAGAEIVGKSTCEYFCLAGNSATSATGRVENPRVPGHSPGGSSTGSGALLAAGEVDLAIGTDQAGSIRIPASFSGVVGLKPTYGLVPYTGVLGIEYTFDHVGPMARTVADCALLLEVLAGDDGIDGRQRGMPSQPYTRAIGKGVRGLKVALIREGFGRAESEAGVDKTVREAAKRLERQGAAVEEVSLPWHNHGSAIWLPIGVEGPFQNIVNGHGHGCGWNGQYSLSFMKAFEGWRDHIDELAPTAKVVLLSGEVLRRQGGRHYAKAQNLRRQLRAEYDAVLARYDALVMPTTPMTTEKIPPADASVTDVLAVSWSNMNNTCPFDISGHPAISVPCGNVDNKPVGFMVVGKHYDESTILQIADAV